MVPSESPGLASPAPSGLPAGRPRGPRAGARAWWLLGLLLLLLGGLAGHHAGGTAARHIEEARSGALQSELAARAACVDAQLASAASALAALRDLHDASDEVTEAEFALFAGRELARETYLHAIAWAPWAAGDGPAGPLRVQPPGRRAEVEALLPPLHEALERRIRGAEPPGPLLLVAPASTGAAADGERQLLLAEVVLAGPARGPDAPVAGVVLALTGTRSLLERAQARGLTPLPKGLALLLRAVRGPPESGVLARLGEPATGDLLAAERGLRAPADALAVRLQAGSAFRPTAADEHVPPWRLGLLVAIATAAVLAAGVYLAVRWNRRTERRTAAVMRRVLEGLGEGVAVADAHGAVQLENPSTAALLGPRRDEEPLADWIERACPGGAALLAGAWERGEVNEQTLAAAPEPPGATASRWLSVSARPLAGEGGSTTGVLVILRDVTARRQATEGLERLQRAIEQTADMVLITNREGVIEYVNPAFETLTGYTRAEALGRTPALLRSGQHPPAFFERLWSTIRSGSVYRATITNRRKDGSLYEAEQTITPVKNASGRYTHFVSVSKDMTERNRLQERTQEMLFAAATQRALFPPDPTDLPGLDISGTADAADMTSGDTYDIVHRADGVLLLSIGDVSGHGASAALLMAEARAYLRCSAAEAVRSPGELLTRLHRLLAPDLPDGRFVTLLLVELDPATRRVRWASAGHEDALHLGPGGAVRGRLGATGPALGIVQRPLYATRELGGLAEGDCLLLATDGALEAPGPRGEPLGEDGLLRLAAPLLERPAAQAVRALAQAVREASRGRSTRDDVTLLLCRVLARPPAGEAVPPAPPPPA